MQQNTKTKNASSWRRLPFRWRSSILFLLCLWTLIFFTPQTHDIIAQTLAAGTLGAIVLIFILSLILWIGIKRRISTETAFISTGSLSTSQTLFGAAYVFSGRPAHGLITIQSPFVWPLFRLEIERVFEHEGAQQSIHIISGRHSASRHSPAKGGCTYEIEDSVVFPHRGSWSTLGLNICLCDCFGFFRWSTFSPGSSRIVVYPPPTTLPPLLTHGSGLSRGDEFLYNASRTGDYYDVKPYLPGEGASKIHWKTYAKSRQLIVREREFALVPEGEVPVYLVASRSEDFVASALLAFVEQLKARGLSVIFGTDGLEGDPVKEYADQRIESLALEGSDESLAQVANRLVWHEDCGTGLGFARFAEFVNRLGTNMKSVVLFAPAGREDWMPSVWQASQDYSFEPRCYLVKPRHKDFYHMGTIETSMKQTNAQPLSTGIVRQSGWAFEILDLDQK